MRHLLPWLAAVALLGCKGSPTSAAPSDTTCDPLAAPSTKLATILGVGKDQAGTLYVAEQGGVPTQPLIVRVFIPVQGVLVRQHVTGSGQLGSTEDLETFESADGTTQPRDLDLQLSGEKATSMTLGPAGSAKGKIEGLDAGVATPLTLVDPSTVQGLPAIDLPGAVVYIADAASGDAIVVTAPLADDLGSAAFHLFYGHAEAMVERPIVSFNQSTSGFPTLGFTVSSLTYVMSIASVPPPDGGLNSPGPVTLTTGNGESVAFTLRQPTPKTLAGFAFTCISP